MLLQPVGVFGCKDADAQLDAFVANEGFGTRNQLQHVCLGFPTERAFQFWYPGFDAIVCPFKPQ